MQVGSDAVNEKYCKYAVLTEILYSWKIYFIFGILKKIIKSNINTVV